MDEQVHIEELRRNGYTRMDGAVDGITVARLLELVQTLERDIEAPDAASIPFLNRGHRVLYNLQTKDLAPVTTMVNHQVLREILMDLLNDRWYKQIPADRPNYILRAIVARSGGPQALPLHIDSFIPGSGRHAWSVQAAIILQPQSAENGCTVAVPGSHLSDAYAEQSALEAAVPIPSMPGDIVVWDSRLWHGTTANPSGATRWSIIATFGRWWLKQNYDIPRTLPDAYFQQLTDEEKSILGYCSMPPLDEFERVDIKAGYEDLRCSVPDYDKAFLRTPDAQLVGIERAS